jgi:oxygen-independent coproporphyrinogen III oxidase
MVDYKALAVKYDAGHVGGYLSYPLINFWRETISDQRVLRLCLETSRSEPDGAYIYFHLPYCRVQCTYCACFMRATSQPEREYEEYTTLLLREVERKLGARSGERLRTGQFHWGGGTPSLLTTAQIRKLCEGIDPYVEWTPNAVRSIEAYPDDTTLTSEKLACLKEHGFTEISFGIESFDRRVLKAINRKQDPEAASRVVERARAHGLGVHFDIVYGLPNQDPESLSKTIDEVLALQPDRLATFPFLYTPRLVKHQAAIRPEWVPGSWERIQLYQLLDQRMQSSNYVRVGVDHYVRGEQDPLARATRDGKIVHHFQGYEPASRETFLGFGSSAISFIGGQYFQNHRRIDDYAQALAVGALPTNARAAHRLCEDDRIRHGLILQALMCRLRIEKGDFEFRFGIDFDDYFAGPLELLSQMELDGLVEGIRDKEIRVTTAGRPLLRVICRVFDRYLGALQPLPSSLPSRVRAAGEDVDGQ